MLIKVDIEMLFLLAEVELDSGDHSGMSAAESSEFERRALLKGALVDTFLFGDVLRDLADDRFDKFDRNPVFDKDRRAVGNHIDGFDRERRFVRDRN